MTATNAAIRDAAAGRAVVVPVAPELGPDGVHLTAAAYLQVAAALRPHVVG